ncbi:hypothetical protein TL16_g12252 [Triparma laevis f. inornata]|uniref:Major facilitator superfamily (MFS) profile domain-containing protein n=1 Tax=Triparma laevis f. inornata TaxID=1714386 RepID=A0A9W7EVW1_9STRA|nr:hypothetical protein TL16_g12252 [Triparma laevis f. inornata]
MSSTAMSSPPAPTPSLYFNKLNIIIFLTYVTSAASVAAPVVLISSIASDLHSPSESESSFSAKVAGYATLGTSLGKALMGFVGDSMGARRTMILSFLCMAGGLVLYSLGDTALSIGMANAVIEYFNSVHWPCSAIILATHYKNDPEGLEAGIFLLSLSSRFGAVTSMPLIALINSWLGWRKTAFYSAGFSILGLLSAIFMVEDAPQKRNEPQGKLLTLTSVVKSLKAVLGNKIWWLVAGAQIGNGMIRTSERVVGSFYSETGGVSDDSAGSLTVVVSIGFLFSVLIFGSMFTKMGNKNKVRFVSIMYLGSILCVLGLGFLSLPFVSSSIYLEVALTFGMTSLMGVQYYQVPTMLASTFGENKGLCSSYIDGVAYASTSILWSGLSWVVKQGDYGWLYGWSSVAFTVVCSMILCNKFCNKFWAVDGKGNPAQYSKLGGQDEDDDDMRGTEYHDVVGDDDEENRRSFSPDTFTTKNV